MTTPLKTETLYEAMCRNSHQLIAVRLDREPQLFDLGIFGDPAQNPQWIERESRTWTSEESPEDVFREHFGAMATDALYATLDRPFLLVMNGQIIHKILIDRGAWDASRIGETSTFLECRCSRCSHCNQPSRAIVPRDQNSLTRTAA